jgi:hypothetical protein
MYQNRLFLSLAIRASPHPQGGAAPSTPIIPSHPAASRVQIHLAVQGAGTTMPLSSDGAPSPHAPLVSPCNPGDATATSEAPMARTDGAAESGLPRSTVGTVTALTPQVEAYIDDALEGRVSQTVARLCDETLDELMEDKIDEKVREALSEQVDELTSIEARVDDLEEREPSRIDEDTFEDLRLDVLTLTGQIDQLTPLRDAVAALTATCEALSARVAQMEQARGGCQRDGEVSAGGAA